MQPIAINGLDEHLQVDKAYMATLLFVELPLVKTMLMAVLLLVENLLVSMVLSMGILDFSNTPSINVNHELPKVVHLHDFRDLLMGW